MKLPMIHALFALMALCLGSGADWLQFRGTENNPVSSDKGYPLQFSDTENLAWKAPLPGRGPAGPIVVGGRVVVTCSSGVRQDRLHVLCFDAVSGKTLWHRQFWATGSTACNSFGAVATPTPASDGRLVFALFSSNDLVCFDLDGNLKWLRGLGLEHPATRNDVGMASSPLVVGRTVVVQCENQGDSFAAGLDAATGETRWRIERDHGAMWASPTLLRTAAPGQDRGPRDLVLMQSRPGLSAHDPDTGRQLWLFPAGCHSMASAVAVEGRIYLPAGGLQALAADPSAAEPKPLWRQIKLTCGAPSPVVFGQRVYAIKDPGILVCGDVADGRVLWQLRLKGPIWAAPIIAGGHLYCVNHDGLVQTVSLDQSEGRVVATSQIDRGVLATPAAADGAIYFRSDANLWKVAAKRD
jgi:outer membrane protein assembly factor BamB